MCDRYVSYVDLKGLLSCLVSGVHRLGADIEEGDSSFPLADIARQENGNAFALQ